MVGVNGVTKYNSNYVNQGNSPFGVIEGVGRDINKKAFELLSNMRTN